MLWVLFPDLKKLCSLKTYFTNRSWFSKGYYIIHLVSAKMVLFPIVDKASVYIWFTLYQQLLFQDSCGLELFCSLCSMQWLGYTHWLSLMSPLISLEGLLWDILRILHQCSKDSSWRVLIRAQSDMGADGWSYGISWRLLTDSYNKSSQCSGSYGTGVCVFRC